MFQFIAKNKDLAIVLGMVLILIILISPIPPAILDLAIILNFGLALTILLMTFYVDKPTSFSTFPSLLLIATLYRLSLNVAATRLILTDGDAGAVIDSIGEYAVSGNFIVGIVVFAILIVVQYVVVTAGAQRVSEVTARFTLDSMPGQQMSIDADLNMGLISQIEALERREELEKQAAFYGSMDGASKFVKGDAIAGIIIILIDIIAGWSIGVLQLGMSWDAALQRYTLLTVGDGIATQLPALIIAVATGIIITRSAKDKELGFEVLAQLSLIPRIPIIVAGILTVMMLLPGMPKWPITILIALCGIAFLRLRKKTAETEKLEQDISEDTGDNTNLSRPTLPLEIYFGQELAASWKPNEPVILERIETLRNLQQDHLGLGFPATKFTQNKQLRPLRYEILISGLVYGSGYVEPDMMLAVKSDITVESLSGIETQDPAFGLPATWIDPKDSETARNAHYTVIDPVTVFMTHFSEVMRKEAAALLTRSQVVKLIEEVRERQSGMIEELIPNGLTVSNIQKILKNLLDEEVSIANLDLIMEHLLELSQTEKNPYQLTELIRQKMAQVICNSLVNDKSELHIMSLDPKIENQISAAAKTMNAASGDNLIIDPKLARELLEGLSAVAAEMFKQGHSPVLLCGANIRRQLRNLTKRSIPKLSVLSVNEIPMNVSLKSFSTVKRRSE